MTASAARYIRMRTIATAALTASRCVKPTVGVPTTRSAGTRSPATASSSDDEWTLAASGLKDMFLWRQPPHPTRGPTTRGRLPPLAATQRGFHELESPQ